MSELYKSLGFFTNPYSKFSAEDELDYLGDIFLPPKHFDVLYNDLLNGNTRIIIGDRGSGKSALMYRLKSKIENNSSFPILIDSFDKIPIKENQKEMLHQAISVLITDFSLFLLTSKSRIKKLDKFDKEKLSNLVSAFYISLSSEEFKHKINKLTQYKTKNLFKLIYNYYLNKSINALLSGGVELAADFISQCLGLPKSSNAVFYKEYLPTLSEKDIKDYNTIDISLLDYSSYKNILSSFKEILFKTGIKSIVIFFDKIDEYKNLKGTITNIATFISDIATDTSLLQMQKLSFVFIFWSRLKKALSEKGIRYDKFKPQDINWDDREIENILEKRISYFSNFKRSSKDHFSTKNLAQVIELSNKSPRDLITLCSYIYDEQSMENTNLQRFSESSVKKGINNFVLKYDYVSYYASAEVANKVVSLINRLLKVGKITFTLKDLSDVFKISQQSTSNYSRDMREYGLISEDEESGGQYKVYYVIDSKIKYMINQGIKKIEL